MAVQLLLEILLDLSKLLDCCTDVRTVDDVDLDTFANSREVSAALAVFLGEEVTHLVNPYRAYKSLRRKLINKLAAYMILNEAVSVLVYENGIWFSYTLQPCGQVYRATENSVIKPLLRPKVANGAKTCGNAHAYMQPPGDAELPPVFLQFRDA